MALQGNPIRILALVFQAVERLNVKMPASVAGPWQKLTATADAIDKLDTSNNMPAALVNAIESGSPDPLRDPEVLAAAARAIVNQQAAVAIPDYLGVRYQQFAEDHAEAILTALDAPFQKAANAVTAGVDQLGDVALDDARAILAVGGNAANTWAAVTDAVKVIEQIRQAWQLLASITYVIPGEATHRALIVADVPARLWLDKPELRKASPWDLARAGCEISLALPVDIYHERVAAIQDEQTDRQAIADGAFRQNFKRSHGVGAA